MRSQGVHSQGVCSQGVRIQGVPSTFLLFGDKTRPSTRGVCVSRIADSAFSITRDLAEVNEGVRQDHSSKQGGHADDHQGIQVGTRNSAEAKLSSGTCRALKLTVKWQELSSGTCRALKEVPSSKLE